MQTSSGTSTDHLKVPANQTFNRSRTSSSISITENPNELQEHKRSNLRLSPSTNSILKQSSSSPRRLSASSHLSVHYTPEIQKNDENLNIETVDSLPITNKKYKNHRYYSLKMPTHYGIREFLHKSSVSPSLLLKRYRIVRLTFAN